MFKLSILVLAFFLFSLVPAHATASTTPSHETWAKSHETEKHAITTLTFYFQDKFGGEDATIVRVDCANGACKPLTAFGTLVVADQPLTENPDWNSKLIGHAQGIVASAASTNKEVGLVKALTFELTDGIYNGSSFSLLGKNSLNRPTREMPVVGGTGLFRWASGFAVVRTYKYDVAATIATFGFNVTLVVPKALKNIT